MRTVCALSLHGFVLSTQLHQYTQCPSCVGSLSLRDTHYVVTDRETEEDQRPNKKIAGLWVKQVKCQRTGYENTTTQARPETKKQKDNETKRSFEMKHNTNDAWRSERLRIY